MADTTVTFIETSASTLETEVWNNPQPIISTRRVCVLVHPWAKLGGSMDDPVVVSCYRAAISSGIFSTVVRYNMRGAGSSRSKWTKNLWDPNEQDLAALCQHLLSTSPGAQLWLVAYSYGSCVASQCLQQVPEVAGYAAIGFPLGGLANLALRSREHWAVLADSKVPKLIVQGTRDKFTALTTLREYAAKYHESLPTPGPLDLYVIDGADHFFEGHWQEIADKVMAWIRKQADAQHSGIA